MTAAAKVVTTVIEVLAVTVAAAKVVAKVMVALYNVVGHDGTGGINDGMAVVVAATKDVVSAAKLWPQQSRGFPLSQGCDSGRGLGCPRVAMVTHTAGKATVSGRIVIGAR